MRNKNGFLTVYALMHFSAGEGRKSLCAIFSSRARAEKYSERLKKKFVQKDDSYIVDAWHVNGAEGDG